MKKILATLLLAGNSFVGFAQGNTTIKLNAPAPELEAVNPAGETVKLSEIAKGRYVLVDFWASWCRPCRMANPRVVDMYNRYKDQKFKNAKKGFTILSVSLDKTKEAWTAAIEKDGLVWPYHMSDLGAWESKLATNYGVQFIPQAFLIGPDGKVVGAYNMAEQAEEELKKMVKGN